MNNLVDVQGLSRRFKDGDLSASNEASYLQVLDNISLSLKSGEMLAIIGASGSGKSTLLHCLAGLEPYDKGQVLIDGQPIQASKSHKMARWRNQTLGFVYQFHHLLNEFNAVENVAMPLLIAGIASQEAQAKAEILLAKVGLEHRLKHFPNQLSGGERQRVAIARALINEPKLVLADEPTGNLDEATAWQIYELLITLNQSIGTAFIVVTHDRQLAAKLDRQLVLQKGQLTPLDVGC